MIKSFRHKGLERFYTNGDQSKINSEHAKRLRAILSIVNSAKTIEDTAFPGGNLHQLKGERKGIWSLTVRANWRITFEFKAGNAYILDYEDYH